MAISNFVPEIWSSSLLVNLRDQLTYASLCNRNYEGDIARAGDTVHITDVSDPAVRSYTKNGGGTDDDGSSTVAGIQWDLLDDGTRAFVIAQADYFAFQVDDIDRRQALGGFVEEATRGASYNLASETDTYVSTEMAGNVLAANQVGDVALDTSSNTAYDLLVQFRTLLTRSNTPSMGRWVVVPPEMYALLLKDDRFIRQDASGTTEGLRNGQVGRAAGFDVIESNVVPSADADGTGTGTALEYTVIAGHDMATTFAQQILSTEAMRLESSFSDGIRGLHVYDAMVLRSAQLASAVVTVS